MFNLNYQLLATPLPYADVSRLHIVNGNLYHDGEIELEGMNQYPSLIEIYKDNENFESKALSYFWEDVIRNIPGSPRVNVTYVTPEYLDLASVSIAKGRNFNINEGLNTLVPVAIISYRSWISEFNSDPSILNKAIQFGGIDFKIVGVTSEDFIEPQVFMQGRETDVWLPWDYNDTPDISRNSWHGFSEFRFLVGKLKKDKSVGLVEHELTTLMNPKYQDALRGRSSNIKRSISYKLTSYKDKILGDTTSRTLLIMFGALALLLIASANITNLILARAASKQRIMAIKVALGAQKKHIFISLFSETFILMSASAILSIMLTAISVSALKSGIIDGIPRIQELSLNWQTCLFAFLVALLIAIFFAFLVSRQIDYRALNSMLKGSGKGVSLQVSANVRMLLIISQVALTGILLIISLQIFFQAIRHIDQPLGFAHDNIQVMTLNVGNLRNATVVERQNYLNVIRDKLRSHPKVANVSLSLNTPISLSRPLWITSLSIDESRDNFITTSTTVIDENYIDILDIPLIAGRHLSSEEFMDGSRVLLVNQTLANQIGEGENVVGNHYYWRGSEPYTVIGIVKDLSLPGKTEIPRAFVRGIDVNYPLIMIEHQPNEPLTTSEINSIFDEVSSQYKVSEIFSLDEARSLLLSKDVISFWLTVGLTVLTICLASVGIYGVISYSVDARRHELGIRMAIGARPNTIFLQVLKTYFKPVSIGLTISVSTLMLISIWIQNTNFHIEANLAGWVLPVLLIVCITAGTSFLSIWKIIQSPVIYALRD